jgi:hypothetical protein
MLVDREFAMQGHDGATKESRKGELEMGATDECFV